MTPPGDLAAGIRPQTRRVLAVLFAVLVAALIVTGHISTDEVLAYVVLVPSVVLHELGHGWVARILGDDTAACSGDLRLLSTRRVDPLGTLVVPALFILSGIGFLGWARPVHVDSSRFRHPRNGALLVALAGPAMSLLLMGVSFLAFHLTGGTTAIGEPSIAAQAAFLLGVVNLWLGIVYLLPAPPLDGSVILERLMPSGWWPRYLRIRPFLLPVLLGICVVDLVLRVGILEWFENTVWSWWTSIVFA